MDIEKLLEQSLKLESARFEVPSSFTDNLKRAILLLESDSPYVPLTGKEAFRNLRVDIFGFFYAVRQPVF